MKCNCTLHVVAHEYDSCAALHLHVHEKTLLRRPPPITIGYLTPAMPGVRCREERPRARSYPT
jgi:hypothetical protein